MYLRGNLHGAAGLIILALMISGCGSGGASGPKTVRVSGVVYLDNEPVEGALVTFSNEGFAATGRTNSEGRYELTQGAVPGENIVTVVKWQEGDLKLNPEEGMDEGQLEAMGAGTPENPGNVAAQLGAKQLIPDRYSSPEKTDLKYPVPEDGTETADLRLQSK